MTTARGTILSGAILAIVVAAYMTFFVAKRLPMTDEGVMMMHAQEFYLGQTPYAEIESPYTPLAFFVHSTWMRLVGRGLMANRAAIVLLAALAAACGAAATRSSLGPRGSAAAGAAVVVATFPYHCYVSYNNYSMFLCIVTACILLRMSGVRDLRGAFLSGAVGALAFLAKQNLGGLALVGACIALFFAGDSWRSRIRLSASLCAGAGIVFFLFGMAAAYEGFLGTMLRQAFLGGVDQAEHMATWYPFDQASQLAAFLSHPTPRGLDALAHSFSFILPFIVAALLVPMVAAARTRGREAAWPLVILATMTPIVALGAVHSPTTWHIIFVKPVPIIAGAFLLKEFSGSRIGKIAAVMAAACFFTLHLGRQVMIFDEYTGVIDAPIASGIRTREWEAGIINKALDILRAVPATEPVFVAAPDPMYYYLTGRTPPLPWIYLDPLFVTEDAGRDIVERLKRSKSWVLLMTGRNSFYDYTRIRPLTKHLDGAEVHRDENVNGVRIRLYRPVP